MSAALELRGVSAYYGRAQVLFDISLAVGSGEVVALVGRNGAGKTSLLRAAMGLMPRTSGSVLPKWRRHQSRTGICSCAPWPGLRTGGSAHLHRSDGRRESAHSVALGERRIRGA